jgi:drug/metabolite transporter superfamily protein YnfA
VAHFFGMHAMQAVPLFALMLPAHLSKNYGCALVAAFSAVYVAFSLATFVQAIEGQPLIG